MATRKQNQVVFSSAARTATEVSQVLSAEEATASVFIINVTAASATPSVVFKLEGKDPTSETFYTLISSAAITGTGQSILQIGKDLIAAANVTVNSILPAEYRITATHADADSITYSVGAIHQVSN